MPYSDSEAIRSWKSLERFYAHGYDWFRKRSLSPAEHGVGTDGKVYTPLDGNARLQNEAACILYLRRETTIPVPELLAAYMDENGCFNVVTKLVSGTLMHNLSPLAQEYVTLEVRHHLKKMKALQTRKLGGPTGITCRPHIVGWFCSPEEWQMMMQEVAVLEDDEKRELEENEEEEQIEEVRGRTMARTGEASNPHVIMRMSKTGELVEVREEGDEGQDKDDSGEVDFNNTVYVFCHNDLSQGNIMVNPDTLKINAILDWEFGGFYPACFEFPYYMRAESSGVQVTELTRADLRTLEALFEWEPFEELDTRGFMSTHIEI